MIDSPLGIRQIQTFRKLPTMAPKTIELTTHIKVPPRLKGYIIEPYALCSLHLNDDILNPESSTLSLPPSVWPWAPTRSPFDNNIWLSRCPSICWHRCCRVPHRG